MSLSFPMDDRSAHSRAESHIQAAYQDYMVRWQQRSLPVTPVSVALANHPRYANNLDLANASSSFDDNNGRSLKNGITERPSPKEKDFERQRRQELGAHSRAHVIQEPTALPNKRQRTSRRSGTAPLDARLETSLVRKRSQRERNCYQCWLSGDNCDHTSARGQCKSHGAQCKTNLTQTEFEAERSHRHEDDKHVRSQSSWVHTRQPVNQSTSGDRSTRRQSLRQKQPEECLTRRSSRRQEINSDRKSEVEDDDENNSTDPLPSEVRKCFYCWHYSQPCDPGDEPKCRPCHNNRRRCWGRDLNRVEFCEQYAERTGRTHKLLNTPDPKPRAPRGPRVWSIRKTTPRKRVKVDEPAPIHFFIEDGRLKCFRCWDKGYTCDRRTPKCDACIKGHARCFGHSTTRKEFCEMYLLEKGRHHRWAPSVLGVKDQSLVTPSRGSTRRITDKESEDSDMTEDSWNSDSDGDENEDFDDTTDNDSVSEGDVQSDTVEFEPLNSRPIAAAHDSADTIVASEGFHEEEGKHSKMLKRNRRASSPVAISPSRNGRCAKGAKPPITVPTVDISKTVVHTRFSEVPEERSLTLNTSSPKDLLEAVQEVWDFQLHGCPIRHCILTLPWRKEQSNFLILPDDTMSTTYEQIKDEIRRAPTWALQGGCSVNLELLI